MKDEESEKQREGVCEEEEKRRVERRRRKVRRVLFEKRRKENLGTGTFRWESVLLSNDIAAYCTVGWSGWLREKEEKKEWEKRGEEKTVYTTVVGRFDVPRQ